MTETDPAVTAWIADFVATERNTEMVEAWVDRTAAAIERGMPQLRMDELLMRDLRLAIEAHWRAFLEELRQPTGEYYLVPPAIQLAVSTAQRQMPLEDLLKFYRLAQQETWDYVTGVVKAIPAEKLDHVELLVRFWGLAAWWIDNGMGESIGHYHAERERIERGVAARRLALVETVLAGEDVPLRELTSGLGGYSIPGIHTALTIHSTDYQAAESLEAVARTAARALGATQPLLVRPGGRQLWVWIRTTREPRLDDLRTALDDQNQQGVTVVVGTPQEGLEGFRSSHLEAKAAEQLLLRHDVQVPVAYYADIEILVLISADESAALHFTRRVLGDLAADTDSAARLRETMLVLFSSGGSVEETARKLVIHKNTVRYRVTKAEEIIGPASDRPGEVATALRYHQLVTSGRI